MSDWYGTSFLLASASSLLDLRMNSSGFSCILSSRRYGMKKKYIVRLSTAEREELHLVIKKLSGSSQKVKRAQILLKADIAEPAGPGWTDIKIAEAFDCRRKTVENIRQRLVEHGFRHTLDGKKRSRPPTPKLLDGRQEAQVIALRLGPTTKGICSLDTALVSAKSC